MDALGFGYSCFGVGCLCRANAPPPWPPPRQVDRATSTPEGLFSAITVVEQEAGSYCYSAAAVHGCCKIKASGSSMISLAAVRCMYNMILAAGCFFHVKEEACPHLALVDRVLSHCATIAYRII